MNRTRNNPLADDLMRPLFHTSVWFYGVVAGAGHDRAVRRCGVALPDHGIGVTGINWPVFWGFYITNFVFWIGISHAGTLISAILRWSTPLARPVTRCAEAITVFALMIGAMFPIIHLAAPGCSTGWCRIRARACSGRISARRWSGILRDHHLSHRQPPIPAAAADPGLRAAARSRDRLAQALYGTLALGWKGTTSSGTARGGDEADGDAILPVAVSVHTIVALDFAMAMAPMWHSTIFGPYFVAGAIFSGIAALIIAMALMRKPLHLEAYLIRSLQ